MSAVKKKQQHKNMNKTTTINKEQLRPHITKNIGLTEQQKTVIGRDRSTPTQDMSPERLTQQKKKFFLLIKPTLIKISPLQKKKKGECQSYQQRDRCTGQIRTISQ